MNKENYNKIIEYSNRVKSMFDIADILLFGSQATGNANKYSDYDIAVIAKNNKLDRHAFLIDLLRLSRDFDTPIEPHPMTLDEYNDPNYILGTEVKKYGIRV